MNRLPHKPHISFHGGRWHLGEAYGTWLNRGKIHRSREAAKMHLAAIIAINTQGKSK